MSINVKNITKIEDVKELIVIDMLVFGNHHNPDLYEEKLLHELEIYIKQNFECNSLGQEQISRLYQVINDYRFEKQYDDLEMRERCICKCNDMITYLNKITPIKNGDAMYIRMWLFDHGIQYGMLEALFGHIDWKEELKQYSYLFEQDLSLFSYLMSSEWSETDMNALITMENIECSIYYLVSVYGHLLSEEQLARMEGLLTSRFEQVEQQRNMCNLSYKEYQKSTEGIAPLEFWQDIYDMVENELYSKEHPKLESETPWCFKRKKKPQTKFFRRK